MCVCIDLYKIIGIWIVSQVCMGILGRRTATVQARLDLWVINWRAVVVYRWWEEDREDQGWDLLVLAIRAIERQVNIMVKEYNDHFRYHWDPINCRAQHQPIRLPMQYQVLPQCRNHLHQQIYHRNLGLLDFTLSRPRIRRNNDNYSACVQSQTNQDAKFLIPIELVRLICN